LYSYRGVRLKQYPIIGFLVVVLNQGALVFVAVSAAAAKANWTNFTASFGMQTTIASLFLIGGFYPLTQIYQHQSDAKDGVKTISMLLGKRGTFVFCAICYAIAFAFIYTHFVSIGATENFLLLQLFFVPVVIVFLRWALAVWKDETAASFRNTMRMNWLAAVCTNAAFITLLIKQQLG
jgi:1,4-dihydroxy-2-naphthoate polyprenyltransferase